MMLAVNEIYGPTVQGEGPSTGRRCAFLRLSGCNLTCVWCDTPYTWDWAGVNGVAYDKEAETHMMSIEDVLQNLIAVETPLIVITGGEPMIQQNNLRPLIKQLQDMGKSVEIETNGTIKPKIKPTRFNVSPKLANSQVRESKRRKPDILRQYVGQAAFKFVCQSIEDLDEVNAYAKDADLPSDDIWIMPEGTTSERLLGHLALITDAAIERGWNISGRLHTLTWGLKRRV
jgi:7-carboxy-7-deazaguanine synthase